MSRPINRENLMSLADQIIWAIEDSSGCRITTGQYTGDGTLSMAVTGVGFQPKVLEITLDGADALRVYAIWRKTDQEGATLCLELLDASSSWNYRDNHIISFDADGFTVDDQGADEHPNKLNQVYNYVAWG